MFENENTDLEFVDPEDEDAIIQKLWDIQRQEDIQTYLNFPPDQDISALAAYLGPSFIQEAEEQRKNQKQSLKKQEEELQLKIQKNLDCSPEKQLDVQKIVEDSFYKSPVEAKLQTNTISHNKYVHNDYFKDHEETERQNRLNEEIFYPPQYYGKSDTFGWFIFILKGIGYILLGLMVVKMIILN